MTCRTEHLGCRFVFSGYNTWQALEQADGMDGGLSSLNSQFAAAVQNDLTVIRCALGCWCC